MGSPKRWVYRRQARAGFVGLCTSKLLPFMEKRLFDGENVCMVQWRDESNIFMYSHAMQMKHPAAEQLA
jgi:hypothetical protein